MTCELSLMNIIIAMLIISPGMSARKVINIGIFINDDAQSELTSLAIASAVRRINLFSKSNEYALRPHIYRTQKAEFLRAGKLVCDLMEKGVAAIFGPESPEINEIIQSVSSSLQIPQFQTFWNPKLSPSSSRLQSDKSIQVFNLYPSPHTLSKALATLVSQNDWKSYTIIYENDDGLLRLQETLKQRNPTDPAVAFRKLGPKGNRRSVLKEIKSSGALHFILDCEVDHILDILREARELKLLSEYHSYILTNLDSHTLDWRDFKDIKTNITAFRLINANGSITTSVQVWNQLLEYGILDLVNNSVIQEELEKFRFKNPYTKIKTNEIHPGTLSVIITYYKLNVYSFECNRHDSEVETVSENINVLIFSEGTLVQVIPHHLQTAVSPYQDRQCKGVYSPALLATSLLHTFTPLLAIITQDSVIACSFLDVIPTTSWSSTILSCSFTIHQFWRHITNWNLINQIETKTALLYDALNLFITVFSEEDAKNQFIMKPLSCEKFETSSHGLSIAEAIMQKNFKKGLLLEPISGPIKNFSASGQRLDYQLELIEFSTKDFRTIGTWKSTAPNRIHPQISSTVREDELKKIIQQTTFRVVSRLGDPYLMKRTDPSGRILSGNDRFEGYAMDLMNEICKPENLNCSYTFELVPDGLYGSYNPETKRWNGLIGELLELKADLAICDLTITYERRKAVDFTMPFMTLGISILYAKAVKEPPELLSFSHPLSLDIWLYMATAYLVISMIIFLVARLNPSEWENPHPCNANPQELENIWNIKNCCWLTLGSIMAQGCDILPKGISTRMVTSMWWFFSLIMTACYTANLAAFLTMERMGPTIESAEDLAAQNKIKYGCVADGATASFFKDTNFSTYHRMWVQMESADPSVFQKNNKDGVKTVLNSKRQYAFLMESSSVEYEMERNCELMQVGNTLDSKGYGIAMPTNARYRKSINEEILKLQEMGVLLKLKDKWWKEMNGGGQCKEEKHSGDETATELGLDHVGGVFVVLAAGVCVALIIAICEFLWNVRKVAVVEHLTLEAAFKKELNFAMDIRTRKKAVVTSASSKMSLNKI